MGFSLKAYIQAPKKLIIPLRSQIIYIHVSTRMHTVLKSHPMDLHHPSQAMQRDIYNTPYNLLSRFL